MNGKKLYIHTAGQAVQLRRRWGQ